MKKIFALAAMFLIGMSAFAGEAWKNHLGFGWRIPTGITLSETQKKNYYFITIAHIQQNQTIITTKNIFIKLFNPRKILTN